MRTIIPKNARLIPKNAELAFKGRIFEVYQWQQKMFDDTSEIFEMLKRPDTIKVIAVKDDKVVILDEQQPGHNKFYNLPGGRHDHDSETEVEAAKRELLEETGMTFKNWRLVSVEQPHSKIDWFVYLFLAFGFEDQQRQTLDAGEKINIELKDFKELKELVNDTKSRYLPKELIESCHSINDLIRLPEYKN